MGRRFQTYYLYNDIEGKEKVSVWHMQNCCGDDTICLLEQSLLFLEKYLTSPANVFKYPKYDFNNYSEKILQSISGTLHKNGVFLNPRNISYLNIGDPKTVDNDEGFFIIDLRFNTIKYALFDYKFNLITPEDYFKLYENEYSSTDSIVTLIPSIIENINEFDTLNMEEVKRIFPNIFEK